MKYLKKFESKSESAKDRFDRWIEENVKYTEDDILYYFSEFSDKFEYDYSQGSTTTSSTDLNDCYKTVIFKFEKSKELSELDSYIEIGKELEIFKKCLNQFSKIEEISLDNDCVKVDISKDKLEIDLIFNIYPPQEIIDKFKVEIEEEEIFLDKNKSGRNFGIPDNKLKKITKESETKYLKTKIFNGWLSDTEIQLNDDIKLHLNFDSVKMENGDRIIYLEPIVFNYQRDRRIMTFPIIKINYDKLS